MRNKRTSRQIAVLRSLFKTLHPILESGLAPARRLLTGVLDERTEHTLPPAAKPPQKQEQKYPLKRTLTDEHLAVELENITRQISGHDHAAHAHSSRRARPQRGARHYSRETLLRLLEEAKVRIQVLETELELARGDEEIIPMLTEEWSDEQQH